MDSFSIQNALENFNSFSATTKSLSGKEKKCCYRDFGKQYILFGSKHI